MAVWLRRELAPLCSFYAHKAWIGDVQFVSQGAAGASSLGCYALTAANDKTVALWDAKTAGRTRQFKGHSSYVNSCCPARDAAVLCTGSDDRSVRVWDTRVRACQRTVTQSWPVTAVSTAHDGMHFYVSVVIQNIIGNMTSNYACNARY